MRQILVDYARYRGAAKRDRAEEVELIESCLPALDGQQVDDWLQLDQALEQLKQIKSGHLASAAELIRQAG